MSTIHDNTPSADNPDEGRADCPSWCINGATCRGDHYGNNWGTVATGGLPPQGDEVNRSFDPPSYDTAIVGPRWGTGDDLPRAVSLFGNANGHEYEVELTIKQARALSRAILNAADTAESD